MRVFEGSSNAPDASAAVEEALSSWHTTGDEAPDIIFAFCSTTQDAAQTFKDIQTRYPESIVVGCTTTGEHISGKHHNGSLVVAGLHTPEIQWSAVLLDNLSTLDDSAVEQKAHDAMHALGLEPGNFDPEGCFSLLFIDGLSMKEEFISSSLADALDGIPLIGGSAGDDLAFERTHVSLAGQAVSDAAVVVLGKSETPFTIIKHQHFAPTPERLVVTRVDPATRRVYEFDGYPALEAYARVLGLTPAEVTNEVTFMNPVTFRCNNEIYVRSIQKIEEDGSITFYCAVEEGMVLEVGGHREMETEFINTFSQLKSELGDIEFILGYNCILRALEAEQRELHDELGAILSATANHVIGFDTYGEQLNGLHINQTLVALALTSAA